MSIEISTYAIGKYVIVRTYSAGVHCGVLVARSGRECLLRETSIIWNWSGANTLREVSLRGVNKESRISEQAPENLVTEAIEILICSPEAEKNLRKPRWS